MMRVLLIAQYYPPDVGGASTRAANIQRTLLERGHNVIVIAAIPHYPNGNVPAEMKTKPFVYTKMGDLIVLRTWIPPLPHSSIPFRFLLYVSFVVSATFVLPVARALDYDAVWALSPNYLCMIPGVIYGRIRGVPVIHDVVDIWPEAILSSGYSLPAPLLPIVRFLVNASYVCADAVVALTDAIRDRISGKVPYLSLVFTVPNAVEDAMFEVPDEDHKDRVFSIVYLGTLAPSNDFEVILRTAEELKQDRKIRFDILGSGECAPEISRFIESHKLDNVFLSGKPVRHEDVPDRLSEADVLILPLKRGFSGVSFPSKLGEYLASGKPVICTADGDLSELIRAERIGVIVSPGSTKQLIQTILNLKANPNLRSELGLRARAYARANLSKEPIAQRITSVIETVCER